MDAFKAKCAKYGVEGYILGPICMTAKPRLTALHTPSATARTCSSACPYELLGHTIEKVAETGIKVAIHPTDPTVLPSPNIQKVVEMVKRSLAGRRLLHGPRTLGAYGRGYCEGYQEIQGVDLRHPHQG